MDSSAMKRVYIDVNHWISLAKLRKAGDHTLEERLSSLVENDQLVVPISCVHLMEIGAISSTQQRQDLVGMIKTIGRGWGLRPLDEVMYLEVRDQLATHFGLPSGPDLSREAIVRGYSRLLGGFSIDFSSWQNIDSQKSAAAEERVWDRLNDDSILGMLLSEHIPKIGKGSDEHKAVSHAVQQDKGATGKKSLDNLERECSRGLVRRFGQLAVRVCVDLSLTADRLAENSPAHFWTSEYVATLPTFDVWSRLSMYIARATERTDVNDLYDLAHLAVAIPYCDIVVTDKAMAHLLTHRKFNEKYGTTVYSNLESCISDL